MKFSVIITNYNYGRFIGEAIESVLNQTWGIPEIIIVNDGSTDDSRAILDEIYSGGKIAKIVHQENKGQLASFAAGFAHATGDVVCFLDADDIFKIGYLTELEKTYKKFSDVDFIYCNMSFFGGKSGLYFNNSESGYEGYSVIFSSYYPYFKTSPTSALSLRRDILNKLFTFSENYYNDFRVCADLYIGIGADIFGASKFYISTSFVDYRVHGNNFYSGKVRSISQEYKINIMQRRLAAHCSLYMGINEEWLSYAAEEFSTKSKPKSHELKSYIRMIARSRLSIRGKVKNIIAVYRHYKKTHSE